MSKRLVVALALTVLPVLVIACATGSPAGAGPVRPDSFAATLRSGNGVAAAGETRDQHLQLVMTSKFCASCHADIYAEHSLNTHGRAFTDDEARLATGRFSQTDCIRCHTPRPIFETGIGMNPIKRHHDLEGGNTCMTCHWRPSYDYAGFHGGKECKDAFDPRVGTVEACASCHRNHGTPYQWEEAPNGKASGRKCIDCHMTRVVRPVATGEQPRGVRSHVFPGARNVAHVKKAYSYEVKRDGDEVVVTIKNKGAGHNFPTELKQRSLESLIVVRDVQGKELYRSRMVFRDPYKRPYGLELPVNTQIPSGQTREHRLPIKVATGSIDCELHFKHYYPIEDNHPDLAWQLEVRRLTFTDITPSPKEVVSEPEVKPIIPSGLTVKTASPGDLVDYVRPPIAPVAVAIPAGDSQEDIAKLIQLFQWPVPEGNVKARKRLVAIGAPAIPALIEALGSWDNKTFNQSMTVLDAIGEPAVPALVAALGSDQLYVRIHAREALVRGKRRAATGLPAALQAGLTMTHALDRESCARAIGGLGYVDFAGDVKKLLDDVDPDVVRAAALALARLGVKDAVPAIVNQLPRWRWAETRRDLAYALALLGDASGIPELLDGLDHGDDLVRESIFEALFAVTGQHLCYDPMMPRAERLEAIGRLQAWWAADGGPRALRKPQPHDWHLDHEVWQLVAAFAGGDGATAPGDDVKIRARLLELGHQAVPVLVQAMKYPPGFADKRAKLCEVLAAIGDADAVPALVTTLRDPVIGVAAWACQALHQIGDRTALPAVVRYASRVRSLAAAGGIPASAGHIDMMIATAVTARLALGDDSAKTELAVLLHSPDAGARRSAIAALKVRFGDDRGYDPEAGDDVRREAAARWND